MTKKKRIDDANVIAEVPRSCPTCQGTEREVLGEVRHEAIGGALLNGDPYDLVRWMRACCECGQVYVFRRYETGG